MDPDTENIQQHHYLATTFVGGVSTESTVTIGAIFAPGTAPREMRTDRTAHQ